jgi:hypothetical protein
MCYKSKNFYVIDKGGKNLPTPLENRFYFLAVGKIIYPTGAVTDNEYI